MFGAVFKKNKSNKQTNKDQLFDAALLQILRWKEQKITSTHLTAFADLILWADKNSPSSIAQLKTHEVISVLTEMYNDSQELAIYVIQAVILIVTNAQDGEFLNYILADQNLLPTIFKKIPDDYELISYYVSLMKIISQRINVGNVNTLLNSEGECLLFQRCLELYSTDDSLAQTAILHIILNFMREKYIILIPFFKSKIFKRFYLQLGSQMIQLFKDMDKAVLNLRQQTMSKLTGMFQELQDLLLFFFDLNKIQDSEVTLIVGNILYHFICLPVIISSLRIKQTGLLSINLSVFILIKLLPLIESYNVHDKVYKSLLSTNGGSTFTFAPYNSKQTAQQNLQNLQLILLSEQTNNKVEIEVSEIRYTLFHLLTSKDDNLVYLVTHLIIKLFESTTVNKDTLIQCGIYLRIDQSNTNQTRRVLLPLVIRQLGSTFRVSTLKNLATILIKLSIIKNEFIIDNQQSKLFCQIYKKNIDKARLVLKNTQHYQYIVESFQNDQKRICQRILQTKQQIGYEAFLTPGEEYAKDLPFFQRLPTDNRQTSRYDLVVFGLLRKIRYLVIHQSKLPQNQINFQKFYQTTLTSTAADYQPGNIYQIPKSLFLPCKLIAGKASIQAYIIEDAFHFIIGAEVDGKLKIVVNLRYKNISPIIDSKAGIIKIKVRGYSSKDQQWRDMQDLEIKADSSMSQKITSNLISRRDLCRQSQLSFISRLLSKCESDIPEQFLQKPQQKQIVQQIDLLSLNG